MPINGAEITVSVDVITLQCKSDDRGFFRLVLPLRVDPQQTITLRFVHLGYRPLEMSEPFTDRIYVGRMVPLPVENRSKPGGAEVTIADARLRYSVKTTTTVSLPSIAQMFEVVNTGNIPCSGHPVCSPDGRWRAAVGSVSLDAGEGNIFRNARVSCIAGPCPFTRIEPFDRSKGGRLLKVSARGWSDSTVFLVEAEIDRTVISDMIRRAYPVIFANGMDFTLPATAEGPSIEAELNGTEIIFPLGPNLSLSWATCTLKVDEGGSKLYRCELKPGYRFR
jgi:hypothetical protein